MGLIWSIVGAFAGFALGASLDSGSMMGFGFFCGGFIGWLLSRVSTLGAQIERVEKRLAALATARPPLGEGAQVSPLPNGALDLRLSSMIPVPPMDLDDGFDIEVPAPPVPPPVPTPASLQQEPPQPLFPATPTRPDSGPGLRLVGWIKTWFSEGNVPVKVGMLVLFAGVAALLKYAADAGWFLVPTSPPIGVAVVPGRRALFSWRQRDSRRAFSLSLQGRARPSCCARV